MDGWMDGCSARVQDEDRTKKERWTQPQTRVERTRKKKEKKHLSPSRKKKKDM
jgi:hypothetical protein